MQSDHIELFEKYVINELNDAEKASFETKLAADPDFQNEFKTFQTLKAGIRLNAMQEKLSMLKDIDKQNIERPTTKSNYTSYLIYLLGFILISVIVYLLTNTKQAVIGNENNTALDTVATIIPTTKIDTIQKSHQELLAPKVDSTKQIIKPSKDKIIIAQSAKKTIWQDVLSLYQRPESFAVILRDTPTQKDLQYKEALLALDNKEYTKVQSILLNSEDEKNQNLLAHSYLLSHRTAQASAIFRNMANDDFSVYHEEAKYYLALCLLENSKDYQKELSMLIDELKTSPKYADKIKRIRAFLVK